MQTRARIDRGGRVVIPAEFRRALGVKDGEEVVLRFEDGEIRLITLSQAIRRAQELVRSHVSEGRSLSDELIAERRTEAPLE